MNKHERYNRSEKGRARRTRYESSRIQVRIAGMNMSLHVPPEEKNELRARLADFRAQQREERRNARIS